MSDYYSDLIPSLKDKGCVPHWFGLGFIQIKDGPDDRYHFWHPELTQDVDEEDIHDHRYPFISQVIRGGIEHHVFEFTPDETGGSVMYDVSCDAASPGPVGEPIQGVTRWAGGYFMPRGSRYNFPAGAFHRTVTDICVTHVTRGQVIKPYARVIRPHHAPHICPFAKTIEEDKLWALMEDCMSQRL